MNPTALPLDYLASIKYHYVHKRFRTPLYTFFLWEGLRHHYNEDVAIDYTMPDLLYLNTELMFGQKIWDQTEARVLAEFQKNPDFILEVFKIFYALNDSIVQFAKRIERTDWSNAKTPKLKDAFDRYSLLSLRLSASMIFPLFLENKLQASIKGAVERRYAQNASEMLQAITTPLRQSAVQKEEISILKMALKTPTKADIRKHLESFAWLANAAMDGHFSTEADVRAKIEAQQNPRARLRQIGSERAKIAKIVAQCKSDLGKTVAKQIDILQEAIYFRSWRTERYYRNAQYLQGFFAEIAKRLHIPPQDFFFLTCREIRDALGGHLLPQDLAQRKQGYIMYASKDATRIYSGPIVEEAAKRIRFLDDHGSIDSLRGQQAYPGKVQGNVCVIHSKADFKNMKQGMILVSHSTTPDYVPLIKMARAIITDEGGVLSHASVISRELQVPCIIGTKFATRALKDGDVVEVDAEKGIVRVLRSDDQALADQKR